MISKTWCWWWKAWEVWECVMHLECRSYLKAKSSGIFHFSFVAFFALGALLSRRAHRLPCSPSSILVDAGALNVVVHAGQFRSHKELKALVCKLLCTEYPVQVPCCCAQKNKDDFVTFVTWFVLTKRVFNSKYGKACGHTQKVGHLKMDLRIWIVRFSLAWRYFEIACKSVRF